jgi:hypothetical protein
MIPVIVVDENVSEAKAYPSVAAAARALDMHHSTVWRAMTGDRGAMTAAGMFIVPLEFDEAF